MSFFRFNYNNLSNELYLIRTSLDLVICRYLNTKTEIIKNLSIALNSGYKNIYPTRIQNIQILKYALQNLFATLLAQKTNYSKNELDSRFDIFFKNKEIELRNLKLLLEANNPKNKYKKGYAQITINDRILSLNELKKGDTITLSDGIISKEARIL